MAGDRLTVATDPAVADHQAWIGYLQPDGLVVSAAALADNQAVLDRGTLGALQLRLAPYVGEVLVGEDPRIGITDLPGFFRGFLEWPDDLVLGLEPARPVPDSVMVPLPDLGVTLSPTIVVADPRAKTAEPPWLILVGEEPAGADLDQAFTQAESDWSASRTRRFERLLRETRVPIGLLCNRTQVRLVYAPRGENAGSLTFPVSAMTEVAGRPILGAFHLLLSSYRLFAAPDKSRLPGLLAASRAYQATVSEALAQQVLGALYELVRGFDAADRASSGTLLREQLAYDPNEIYGGLLVALLRTVFLLYAEDRELMPGSELYVRHYSIHGLFERLRQDHEEHPDTMDQRFGAWSQVVAVFRAVYLGVRYPLFMTPPRRGYLFDPNRYPFLEGRSLESRELTQLPLVSDGVVFRVLEKLLVLDGERLSYRTLDVEQIGTVYETMMGFELKRSEGHTIALKPLASGGAPVGVDLEALFRVAPRERAKWLGEAAGQKLTGPMAEAVKRATTVRELEAALERRIARNATPDLLPPGSLLLQPTDERRRSGSHYTPRALTEPIVRTTLEPVLARLGPDPTPRKILDLKVADIAVGSGAFLVEVCRQLAEVLVAAWRRHGDQPFIPADEDEVLHARRLVAQRCLYGVDRNPMAVDLAKLSLWLATLARDHPFTFLDHSFRTGDSLVGLTKRQVIDFHWKPLPVPTLGQEVIGDRVARVSAARREILDADDEFVSLDYKANRLRLADDLLSHVRQAGSCVMAAFFGSGTDRGREAARDDLLWRYTEFYRTYDLGRSPEGAVEALTTGPRPILPFHWEIEFPEVFDRPEGGFDVIVGNPPFAGKNTLINGNRAGYLDWLKTLHAESHGNADLVAHFFRRAFNLLRPNGAFGLIATNTIGQGDTRFTGLRWIGTNGGTIFAARKRVEWQGAAAVVVSVVHVTKGVVPGPYRLDGRWVPLITAYLFHAGGHENPAVLRANAGKSFQGSIVLGMGFTFDDTNTRGVATPLAEMRRLIAENPKNAERIFPYIGGEEVNDSPTHAHHRYVINFGEMSEAEARAGWPDLMRIVEEKVRPQRQQDNREVRRRLWWRFAETTPALVAALRGRERVLALSRVGQHGAFTFLSTRTVFAETIVVLLADEFSQFAVLQSRCHEAWARLLSSSMKDDMRYTPSDCFETFPFPASVQTVEQVGREYYEFRAAVLVQRNEGLTTTYNRFHDPNDQTTETQQLRARHAAMDRAVLDAYGWTDLQPVAEFLSEHEADDDAEVDGPGRRRKYRYRWPDLIRDEVLARLLALNAQRAEAERLGGLAAAQAEATKLGRRSKGRGRKPSGGADLFEPGAE